MGEICLSVAPILRCQSLTRLQAGILLLPPGLEIILACVLLWIKRRSADKKHMLLAIEIYVYFFLSLLDLFTHTLSTLGSSLDAFRSLDIFIGVTSIFPLFLYTLSLYLLTSTELVPSLPVRLQSLAKYILLAFIPLILVLNEVGSFISISYRSFGGQDGTPVVLGVGFTNSTIETALSDVTLGLLTAFQALNFCIAFFRLVKAFSHHRTLESTEKKELEAHVFRGLGWIVAGLKLGAIETAIGFAQGGFAIAFARRLIRMLAHACLIIGIVKGVDTVEDFQLYSPSEHKRRRKSALRAMIQNPRFSTFRHIGGHDFDAENPVVPKHDSVIKLGDPSWMRRDFKYVANEKIEESSATPGLLSARKSSSLTFMLTGRPSMSIRTSSRKSKGSSVRDSTSSFGSSKRKSWPIANNTIEEDEGGVFQDEAEDVIATEFEPVLRPRPAFPRPERERVTVYMRQDRLPILQLRRLSNLEFLDLVTDPFRDHGRARSLPGNFDEPQGPAFSHVSASFTRLPAYKGAPAPGVPPVPIRPASTHESVASGHSRSKSVTTHDRPASVVSQATERPPSPAAYSKRDSGVSFQPSVRDSVASYNGFPRDSMMSYDPSARDSMISYNLAARDSMISYNPRDSTLTYSRPPSTMSFHAIGTPGTAASFDLPSAASQRFGGLSRKDRGLSSSTTASEVHALAAQFPGIPARPFATGPRPRSMLSHEVSRTEFVTDQAEPMPANAAVVQRAPSALRKPIPFADVPEEVEGPSEPSTPQRAYQDLLEKAQVTPTRVLSEQEATQSLPTPLSPPHTAARWPAKRARSLSAVGKRRPPPLELAVAAVADVQATQAEQENMFSASVAQGGQLVRVKSLGSALERSVSASQRSAFARESVQVELGHVLAKGRSIAGPVDSPKRAKAAAERLANSPAREAVDVVRPSVFEEV
ncbi:hypothetical protein C2E23DRAFT_843281 [Lenzites betulinus]|nr:hypothetical protein C2E23DRAFT_843281 [Lenzites betulinus]